eukprot:4516244-Pleurochrysis_carterae.AAC.1
MRENEAETKKGSWEGRDAAERRDTHETNRKEESTSTTSQAEGWQTRVEDRKTFECTESNRRRTTGQDEGQQGGTKELAVHPQLCSMLGSEQRKGKGKKSRRSNGKAKMPQRR